MGQAGGGSNWTLHYANQNNFFAINIIGAYDTSNIDIPVSHMVPEIAIYKLDLEGGIIGSRTYGGNKDEYFDFFHLKPKIFQADNRIVICAFTTSKDGDVLPMYPLLPKGTHWLLIIDTSLNIVNSYNLGGKNENWNDIALSYYYDGDHLTAASVFYGSCPALQIQHNPWGTMVMYDINQYTLVSELHTTPLTVKIIPNPVRNRAIMQLEGEHIQDAAWLKVYDINGDIVLCQQIKQSVEQIDVSNMPAGIYVYEVLSNIGQQLFNGKIIVLH